MRLQITDRELTATVARSHRPASTVPSGMRHYAALTIDGSTYYVFALDRSHALSLVHNYQQRIEGKAYPYSVRSCRLVKDAA